MTLPLTVLTAAPRVINVPLAATTVAPVVCSVEPFSPGQITLALSAGAGQIFGSCHPGRSDQTRYLSFQVSGTDIAAAASTLGQVAAAREADGDVSGDLTVSLGTVAAPLPIGILPVDGGAINAADLLNAIVLVNGVPFGRITDANAPNPGVGQWGLDADTEIGTILVIGASTGTSVIKVGSLVEIIKPDTAFTKLLAKSGRVTGAALVAGVAEQRELAVPVSTTDTAGRVGNRLASVNFVAADVAAVALAGIK